MPVNRTRQQVQGLPCYSSVDALPDAPDTALIAVPAADVVEIVEALGKRGCGTATLFSSGFAEAGETGRLEQARLLETAKRYGMRLLGLNTLGVFNVENSYYGTFSSSLDGGFPLPGNIGLASQSGAFGAHIATLARDRHLGASVLITTGNEADITVGEAIGWMAQSSTIDVICAYLEGINEPETLLAALDAARAAGKPVLVMKAGRSLVGSLAAASHTASLTGDAAIADVMLRSHGAILVRDSEQMLDFAYAAHQKIYPIDKGLGFVTISGGAGIVASDEAERLGMPMPPMPEDAQTELKTRMPISSPINPLDCTAQALNDPTLLTTFMRAALERGGYGSVICFVTYVLGNRELARIILKEMAPLRAAYPDRLIAFCATTPADVQRQFEDAGFLMFQEPNRAVRSLHAMGQIGSEIDAPQAQALALGDSCVELPAESPDEYNAKLLLTAEGVMAAPEKRAATEDEAAVAAKELGFPVVLKVLSADIVHKSDIGGVRLNLNDEAEVRLAYRDISATVQKRVPGTKINGILVARQISGGIECFMGIKQDPGFGPMAVFGLGGIFVEILNDVVIRACPFDEDAARDMIGSIKACSILTGARGRPPADVGALASMLSRLSIFAAKAGPRLSSIDLNPVVVQPGSGGAFALDAVIQVTAHPAEAVIR
ncbi:Trans-feruloyl-CoA synthase FCS1 (plasmid) [Sphingobium sp. AntQ-1]|nr:Trans-feruloyl-CoA synthase FCS1 [Sphingobium sp. AntQ-1]